MTPERWEEVKALFAQAVELPAEKRASWIESRDAELEVSQEVLRLLREHELSEDGFLGPETQGAGALLDRAARVLAASASSHAAPGNLLAGRYEVIRELGSGGGGIVYLAQDRALHNRPVVLKFLFPGGEAQERQSRRFRQEIEALARIRHPGVVGALDVGQTEEGRVFLVMEYVEGVTLRAEMEAQLALQRIALLITQIAEALSAAHQAGVLHRDLKPENVMLQRSGGQESVKLIDFGIAKVQYSEPGQPTHTVTFVGTINYVAPEQLMGQASAQTDVYAMGILTYEMLTGRRPFDPDTPFALYELQKSESIVPPSRFRRDIAPAVDRAVLRALSFDPAKRQSSPDEFARELSDGLARRPSKLSRYRRAILVTVVVAAAALMSLLLRERVGVRAPSPIITTVAGSPPARLGHLQALTADRNWNIYVSATARNQILKLTIGSVPSTTVIAGTGKQGFGGDGGDPAAAQFNNPIGLAVDTNGDLYIVDQNNSRIRKLTFRHRIINTVVGSGIRGFAGDGGDPKNAQLASPFGIVFDTAGSLFIGDQGNNRVRRVRFGPNPVISTVAGSGIDGFSGDGGDPSKADLSAPSGLAFDGAGDLYFSDEHNNRIRKITFGLRPTISTVVGAGVAAFSGDNGDPGLAGLSGPQGIAIDTAGNLYIADYENHRIRKVTFGVKPVIKTVAGTGIAGFSGDGGSATAARLSLPTGVTIGADGNLYIADYLNDRIRLINTPTTPSRP
jgi:sugar lactone lactonase YvrE/predicted Ser/Thr protein kinase